MRNKKRGFTLVELIVVISITVIISVSAVFGFFNFLGSFEVKKDIESINEQIINLDDEIKKYETLSYKIIFNKNDLALANVIYKNSFGLNTYSEINFDSNTGSGEVYLVNGSGSEIWSLKNYKGKKLIEEVGITSDDNYEYLFNNNQSYNIKGLVSSVEINDILIKYFTESNLEKKGDEIYLTEINSESNFEGVDIGELKIQNISGKKKIFGDNIEYDTAFLKFEKKGIEEILEIKNK